MSGFSIEVADFLALTPVLDRATAELAPSNTICPNRKLRLTRKCQLHNNCCVAI